MGVEIRLKKMQLVRLEVCKVLVITRNTSYSR